MGKLRDYIIETSANYTVKNDEEGRARIRDTRRLSRLHNLADKEFDKAGVRRSTGSTRVDVRGRLGVNNPNRDLYSVDGPLHRHSGQRVKDKHAQRLDVYVGRKY